MTDAKAELARVNAERYTDQAILSERDRHIEWAKALSAQDERLHAIDDQLEKLTIKNQQDIANLKENIVLQNEIDNKNAEIKMLTLKNDLDNKINNVASTAAAGIQANAGGLASLQNTVNSILNMTQLVIPSRNVCNTGCGCGCAQQ